MNERVERLRWHIDIGAAEGGGGEGRKEGRQIESIFEDWPFYPRDGWLEPRVEFPLLFFCRSRSRSLVKYIDRACDGIMSKGIFRAHQ